MDSSDEQVAVEYFRNFILSFNYPISLPFIQVQIGNVSPKNIQKLMKEQYSGEDLINFFAKYSNVFAISKLGIVSVKTSGSFAEKSRFKKVSRNLEIEEKIRIYFTDVLKFKFSDPQVHVSHLYNYIDAASDDVIDYLNYMYPGETFELFFYRFTETFQVSSTLNISLMNQTECKSLSSPDLIFKTEFSKNSAEELAVQYYRDILLGRYKEPVLAKSLKCHLGQADAYIEYYIKKTYPTDDDFESFFKNHPDTFNIDGAGVVHLLEKTYPIVEETHEYFKKIICQKYPSPVNFNRLRGHLSQASDDVMNYMNSNYSGEDLFLFFSHYPDIYSVNINKEVTLTNFPLTPHLIFSKTGTSKDSVEELAVQYYRDILLNRYKEPVPAENLKGHLGQADEYIRNYIKMTYPTDNDFETFFENHTHIFNIDGAGMVSLWEKTYPIIEEIHEYFKKIICQESPNPVPCNRLRGHLPQASKDVRDYMNYNYSGDNLFLFFNRYPDVYSVNFRHEVTLKNFPLTIDLTFSEAGSSKDSFEELAMQYYRDILLSRYKEPVPAEKLKCHLGQADVYIKNYIKKTYPSDNDFETFFENHSHIFNIDGAGIVSLSEKTYPILEEIHEYFKKIICLTYSNPVHFIQLRGHLSQAPKDVMNYMVSNYSGDNLLLFFKQYPDIYSVNFRSEVTLKNFPLTPHFSKTESSKYNAEELAVQYYRDILLRRYKGPVTTEKLKGHLGQADEYIKNYIKKKYPTDDDFETFFENHSHVFGIDGAGMIYLKENSHPLPEEIHDSKCRLM